MRVDPNSAGFCDQRLERISEHLDRNYIAPGKIPGCQVSSRQARTRCLLSIIWFR